MKLSKRVVLSLMTILISIGIFAVSVDQARADGRFSTSYQLDKVLSGNENQTYATLGLSSKNLGRQFINSNESAKKKLVLNRPDPCLPPNDCPPPTGEYPQKSDPSGRIVKVR